MSAKQLTRRALDDAEYLVDSLVEQGYSFENAVELASSLYETALESVRVTRLNSPGETRITTLIPTVFTGAEGASPNQCHTNDKEGYI